MTTARAPVCARKGGAGQAWRLCQRRPGRHNDVGAECQGFRLGTVPTQMLRCLRSTFSTDRRTRGADGPGPLCEARLAQRPVIALTLGALIRVWVPPPCLGLSPGIEVERRAGR